MIYEDAFKNNNYSLLMEYVDYKTPVFYKDKIFYAKDINKDFNQWCFKDVNVYIKENTLIVSLVPAYEDNTYKNCNVEFVFSDNPVFKKLKEVSVNDEIMGYIFFNQPIEPAEIDVNRLLEISHLQNIFYYNIRTIKEPVNTYFIMDTDKERVSSLFGNLPYTTPSTTDDAVKQQVLKLTQVEDFKTIGRIYIENITYKSFMKNNNGQSLLFNLKVYYITQKKSNSAFVCVTFPEKVELSY